MGERRIGRPARKLSLPVDRCAVAGSNPSAPGRCAGKSPRQTPPLPLRLRAWPGSAWMVRGKVKALDKIVPVILSGGSGTRLWPESTTETPKQLLALTAERTMLQLTAERVSSERFEP